jgi:hypothetical protein
MCNIFDQLIQTIVSLGKLVIYADCGEIMPLFLNIGLACDHPAGFENFRNQF